MLYQKKSVHKPFYKKFLRIRKNIQNRRKLFNFKKKKWEKLQYHLNRQANVYTYKVKDKLKTNFRKSKFKLFNKRYKLKDPCRLKVFKYSSMGNSFKKRYLMNLFERITFNLFYGGFKKRYLRKQIKHVKQKSQRLYSLQQQAFKVFESRLDTVLYRAKFGFSVKNARQLIRHGHILVNGEVVRAKGYMLKTDDLVEAAYTLKSRLLVRNSLNRLNFWPLPPSHLMVNYKTCQIIFLYDKNANIWQHFDHYINWYSLINNINKI